MIPLNPLAYFRFAARVLHNSWKHRATAGIGLLKQTSEIARLLSLNKLEPFEYYEYSLHDGRLSWDEKKRFMSHHQASRFYTEVNDSFERGALNKLVVHTLFKSFNLPAPRLYGYFDRTCGRTATGEPLRSLDDLRRFLRKPPARKIVIKPVSSQRGFGVKVINIEADGHIEDVGFGKVTIESLYDTLVSSRFNLNESPNDIYLFQEHIKQHPFFDRFADSCTQCLRIITFITTGGEIEVLNVNVKLGVQGKVYDNTRDDGLSAGVNGDGTLQVGIAVRNGHFVEFETHPLTGAILKGAVVPYFPEAVELARRAQALFPQVRSIGWDIAVTANGPVIIEGNVTWSRMTQQHTRVGLISDAVRRELEQIV